METELEAAVEIDDYDKAEEIENKRQELIAQLNELQGEEKESSFV